MPCDKPMETLITAASFNQYEPAGPLHLPEHTLAILLPSKDRLSVRFAGSENSIGPGLAALVSAAQEVFFAAFPEQGWLILFTADVWQRFLRTHPEYGLLPLFDPAQLQVIPVPGSCHTIASLLADTTAGARSPANHSPVNWHLLSAMLLQLCESYRLAKRLPVQRQPHPALRQLLALIDQHFRQERRAAFYAERLGMNRRPLNQLCQRFHGRSTSQLIGGRILAEAERLLSETDLQIKQIAYELGFATPEGFTHFFKKHSGLQPLAYRQQTLARMRVVKNRSNL